MGMMRKNRKEIPDQMKDIKGVPILSCRYLYTHSEYTNTLLSFVAKKTKNIVLLSNIHFQEEVPKINNPKSKPLMILDYNAHKSGVDKNNQMVKEFKPCRSIHRWPTVVFFDLLGEVALASWILYCLKHPKDEFVLKKERRQFLHLLGSSLVLPSIVSRESSDSFKYCNKELKSLIQTLLPNTSTVVDEPAQPCINIVIPIKRGRCYLCDRGKDTKKRSVCSKCLKHVCETHSTTYVICKSCEND